ncbi:MAG: DUF4974 domain-containing protein [Candidatus Pedobacter colombiensis]|uniref:DUF4974 domain-containing protein n=1 Tax=Candidatus Pedobacter colombiensis TaxID=3121371 RepID=A0AAJ5W7J1_9SPHI|nr:FecR family protein [Pedobacter sp.]WEK18404.1 MAG: DUF4974 domain-containing protein [Pedobacter sp.]
MNDPRTSELLEKYRNNTLTEQERLDLYSWYSEDRESQDFFPDIDILEKGVLGLDNELSLGAFSPMQKKMAKNRRNWFGMIAIAAAVAIVMGVTTLLTLKEVPLPKNYANDVKPGSNKATLTLANGKTINLSDAKNGELAQDQGVKIVKAADGQLLFEFKPDAIKATSPQQTDSFSGLVSEASRVKDAPGLNCVVTPRGGQYHIALPDGTNVWINSGSTLRFPSTFWETPERRVYLKGEAYFEVKQVKSLLNEKRRARKIPFIIQTDKQEVTVLGTHFNINSYDDEPNIKTTLLEGLVKVSSAGGGDAILKAGQQAVNNGSSIQVATVDTEMAVAWKNGEFMFRNETLASIMRKIARWYDVEIIFENKQIGNELFGGTITKYGKLSQVLCVLESTSDIKFKIQNKKVIVLK